MQTKTVEDRMNVWNVYHAARTGTAFVVIELNASENGHGLTGPKWKCVIFVAKQDAALCSGHSGCLAVFIPVKYLCHKKTSFKDLCSIRSLPLLCPILPAAAPEFRLLLQNHRPESESRVVRL